MTPILIVLQAITTGPVAVEEVAEVEGIAAVIAVDVIVVVEGVDQTGRSHINSCQVVYGTGRCLCIQSSGCCTSNNR
jgi:hypothetical protein